MASCDEALRSIDMIYSIVEEIEKHVGRLTSVVRECGGRGDLFAIYNMLVKIRDELAELRRIVSEQCGGVR
jgi:phosphomevalonate kinase